MNDATPEPTQPTTSPAAGKSVRIGETAPDGTPAVADAGPPVQPRFNSGVIYAISGVIALALITVMVLATAQKGEPVAAGSAGGPAVVGAAPEPGSMEAIMSEGSPTAPNVLREYADYRCPYCGVWAREEHKRLQPFIDNGTLRMEYRDVAMFGENSVAVAAAARAAGKQGKFWPYWTVVFDQAPTSGHPDYSDEQLVGFAKKAGVKDLGTFVKDAKSDELKNQVIADTKEATQVLRHNSVPTFSLNGTPIQGSVSADVIIQRLRPLTSAAPSASQ